MLLRNKVVVVSGIGPGLGIHLATLAAEEGADLVIACRNVERLKDAAARVAASGFGARVVPVQADVTRRTDCALLVEAAMTAFGRIDGLVNSAYSGGAILPVDTADLEDWRRTMEVNLYGTMNLCQAVIPQMRAQGGGSIVNVNSQVVHKPLAGQGGYAASKAALAAATSHLALECGKDGIRANSVFLGWMWGPAVEGYFDTVSRTTGTSVESMKAAVAEKIALGRIPTDRECARSIMFLLSDHASVVTGASLDVNGGEYLPG